MIAGIKVWIYEGLD